MSVLDLRADAARENAVTTTPNYVTFKDGNITEVRCKVCSVPIRKLVASEQNEEVIRVGSRTIIRERVILSSLPNYREVLLKCDDGSAHVTPVCGECAPKLSDAGVREECYSADLKMWSREGEVAETLVTRNPQEIVEIVDVGNASNDE